MRRKIYWLVLLNPAILVLYFIGMRILSLLCQYGSVRRRGIELIVIGGIGFGWFILWTIVYFIIKRNINEKPLVRLLSTVILTLELIFVLGTTGFWGFKIYESATNFSGKLAWYIHEKESSRKIELKDNNFLKTGMEGIIKDIDDKVSLPKELYITNYFEIRLHPDGTIQSIYAFLYGKNKEGITKTYLIDYNADKSNDMTIWLDGEAKPTYHEQNKLQPMQDMVQAFVKSNQQKEYISKNENKKILYTISYKGYISEPVTDRTLLLYADGQLKTYSTLSYEESIKGYLLNVSRGEKKILTIASDVNKQETNSESEKTKEKNPTLHKAGDIFTDENGDMHYYYDATTEMTLKIVDAALGSRAYVFEGTVINQTPFGAEYGLAEGMYFLDKQTGFAGLSTGSKDSSSLYYTQDGGANFTKLVIPVSDGESALSGNTYGYTSKDFGYIGIPYQQDKILYVKVGTDSNELNVEYMLFTSTDAGKTWKYLSYKGN